MHVEINKSKIKAFVNNVKIEGETKVYTLSDLEGKELWNGDRRTFDESQVTELEITIILDSDLVEKEPLLIVEGEMALLKEIEKGNKNVIAP